jgi:hypothetical protein
LDLTEECWLCKGAANIKCVCAFNVPVGVAGDVCASGFAWNVLIECLMFEGYFCRLNLQYL